MRWEEQQQQQHRKRAPEADSVSMEISRLERDSGEIRRECVCVCGRGLVGSQVRRQRKTFHFHVPVCTKRPLNAAIRTLLWFRAKVSRVGKIGRPSKAEAVSLLCDAIRRVNLVNSHTFSKLLR